MRGIGTLLSLLLASSALAQGEIPWTQVKETCDMTIGEATCGDYDLTFDADGGQDGVITWDVTNDRFLLDYPATGAHGAYEMEFGSGNYGGIKVGQTGMYCSSFSASGLDLDRAFLFRQEGSLGVGNDPGIEFAWMEGGNSVRMAIPESGAGNATAFIRSGTFAGPYSAATGNDIVLCDTWSSYNGNIDCDTSSTGADLFIQDDLEVEGTIFAHESINFEGATADGNQVILQVGADPGSDVTLSMPTSTGSLALERLTTKGDLHTYGTAPTRLAVGSNGEFLIADSTEATGLRWDAISSVLGGVTVLSWGATAYPTGTTLPLAGTAWATVPTVVFLYQGSFAQFDSGLSHRFCFEAYKSASSGCSFGNWEVRLYDNDNATTLVTLASSATSATKVCSTFTWSAPASDATVSADYRCAAGSGNLVALSASWVTAP